MVCASANPDRWCLPAGSELATCCIPRKALSECPCSLGLATSLWSRFAAPSPAWAWVVACYCLFVASANPAGVCLSATKGSVRPPSFSVSCSLAHVLGVGLQASLVFFPALVAVFLPLPFFGSFWWRSLAFTFLFPAFRVGRCVCVCVCFIEACGSLSGFVRFRVFLLLSAFACVSHALALRLNPSWKRADDMFGARLRCGGGVGTWL